MQLITTKAKPFLKWAGGKTQVLEQMSNFFPVELKLGKIKRYVEPFIGGGAVFFYVAQMYNIDQFFISDVNEELVLAYKTVQSDVDGLIDVLREMERKYLRLNIEKQEKYFYDIRSRFNESRSLLNFHTFKSNWVERTAQSIFLNRTCFNGLFQVNSKTEFNIPFGRDKTLIIC